MDSRARPRGRGGARKPLTVKRILLLVLAVVLAVHLLYMTVTSVFILAYKFVNPPFTVLMPYRAIGYGWKLQKPIPLPLKKVPVYIRSMLIAVEDGNFYQHHGIEMEAFKRAREINAKVGKPLYGGSTLTMQVARTLFLVPEKSYVRKYFEVIAALELELFLSKDRILELYFGYAEWGKGIFGIEAASRKYFGEGVGSIDRDQAARLIALLSSPIKYTPATLSKSAILRERYAYLTRRFVAPGIVPQDQVADEAPPPSPEPGVELPEEAASSDQAAVPTVETEAVGAPAVEPGGGSASGQSPASSTEPGAAGASDQAAPTSP